MLNEGLKSKGIFEVNPKRLFDVADERVAMQVRVNYIEKRDTILNMHCSNIDVLN